MNQMEEFRRGRGIVKPLLLIDTLREALLGQHAAVWRCPGDADSTVAVLAAETTAFDAAFRARCCDKADLSRLDNAVDASAVVLSADSDLFIHRVGVVPFTFLRLSPKGVGQGDTCLDVDDATLAPASAGPTPTSASASASTSTSAGPTRTSAPVSTSASAPTPTSAATPATGSSVKDGATASEEMVPIPHSSSVGNWECWGWNFSRLRVAAVMRLPPALLPTIACLIGNDYVHEGSWLHPSLAAAAAKEASGGSQRAAAPMRRKQVRRSMRAPGQRQRGSQASPLYVETWTPLSVFMLITVCV